MPNPQIDLGEGVDAEIGDGEIEISDIGGFVILSFAQFDELVDFVGEHRRKQP